MIARLAAALTAGFALVLAVPVHADPRPPSQPTIDAPELARLGPYAVGLKRFELIQAAQVDLTQIDLKSGQAPVADRVLPISLWYPAKASGGAPVTYAATLPPEKADQPPVVVSAAGVAVLDAPALAGQRFPLVILSHGYSGAPEAMTWLAENLASKGYVVAAIAHRDPPYGDPRGFAGPVLRRPLDQAFVAQTLQAWARGGDPRAAQIDPDRVVLIGYSMGGYGVLTQAVGGFDPAGSPAHLLPARYIAPYLPGGDQRAAAHIEGVKAVVAISPFTGPAGAPAFSAEALAQARAPILIIAGDQDETVGFARIKAAFQGLVHAPRRLLVLREAGHSIGMNPAVAADYDRLWDLDWFEDPVWRKDRVIGVSLHMITAFLDLNVKGDTAKAAYLDPVQPVSDAAVWPEAKAGAYGAYSDGAAPVTVWKGFQRVHSAGLELIKGDPAP